jgi:RNA polymerase-binding transcription factor DksA
MIAALFYVTDDASSSPAMVTAGPDDTLTSARIDKIRDELGLELAQLKHRLAVAWPSVTLEASEGQYDSAVDQVRAKQRAAAFFDRLQERRGEILDALDRMQKGTYGRCAVCGESIPFRRLEVVPETHTCIRCYQ